MTTGRLTTHVLDTASGQPAAGVQIRLKRVNKSQSPDTPLTSEKTNQDGRCDAPLLEGTDMAVGQYVLEFDIGEYFKNLGHDLPDPPFLDCVVLHFNISDLSSHYHVPLLVSPFGYSTYRGS